MDDTRITIDPADFEGAEKTALECMMDANRVKEAQRQDEQRKAADADILRVFREAERRRASDAVQMREALQNSPDALVNATRRAKVKKADMVSLNINGAQERNMRVRMEVGESPVTFANVCSFLTLVVVGAIFVLNCMGVW